MQKVLIVGLGSIGQRHAKALISLGIQNIAALRTRKGAKDIDSNLVDKIVMFSTEEEAFNWQPTHVIISNPTSLHKHYIARCIEKNIRFFVEKPISDKFEDVLEYQNTEIINGLVGYNLRFHGLFQYIKSAIDTAKFGKVITAQLHVGQYLPIWHPYEDYRKAYYAKKELGGGAIRTLSHEIDLAQYLFGHIETVYVKAQKLSNLETDVDDVVNMLCESEFCKQISIHINFLDPFIVRKGSIYFENGRMDYDFVNTEVKFLSYLNRKEELIYNTCEDFELQYKEQMEDFLFEDRISRACTFEQGIKVMKIIQKSEEPY